MDLRKNSMDTTQKFSRSSRFYQIGNAWYFDSREGKHMGPYKTDITAELEFTKFLRAVKRIETNRIRNNSKVA